MQTIDAKRLDQMRSEGEPFVLINVLPEEAFRKQHIPGSINIPVDSDDFEQLVQEAAGSTDQKVVVYCANTECTASPEAATKLEEAGFTDVVDFEGGMQEWIESDRPVEREAA